MSIGKKNKDHLKKHAGVKPVALVMAPTSADPLRFWTGHPTENVLINLYPFANGENENPHPKGGGNWAGPFSGRPKLIRELGPAIQARCALATESGVQNYLGTLRAWWRLFDAIESKQGQNGQKLARVESVSDLHALHESAAHQHKIAAPIFSRFRLIVNDARRLHKPRLPDLPWIAPKGADPIRHLLPEDQAKELRIMIKQDWEAVRRTWARHDAIRAEAQRRARFSADQVDAAEFVGLPTPQFSREDERLLKNCEHFLRIQRETGLLIPYSEKLLDGENRVALSNKELELRVMRAIFFPTVKETDIAFHLALIDSGWNPSTLIRTDASKPDTIFEHPKNSAQWVLGAEDAEVSMKADKPRARGKTQYCYALKKNKASPPAIVAAYLERSAPLREQLRLDCDSAEAELVRLQATQADQAAIEIQFKKVQMLQEGCRSVWLYLDNAGSINWLNWKAWGRYGRSRKSGKLVSYLGHVLERLNEQRESRSEPPIGSVTPSDFRDIYARRIYRQTGGNILAVMLALGHSTTQSTGKYLNNNIFSMENDGHARRFMTNLFSELELGRVDLTILAQLVRHGPLTPEMEERLKEYRGLMLSRVGVGCTDPRHPPDHVAPAHQAGKLCGTQRCLRDCQNAKFLPESIDGIAMRVEELVVMSENLPRETWLRGDFHTEIESGEYILNQLYLPEIAAAAREKWRGKIARGEHMVPGMGLITGRGGA